MPNPHDKLIAAAAKEILGPIGCRRNGRSRVWLADESWWLVAVEFQPSGWAKGSYLNVAAHWLWVETDHLSFDYGGRVDPFKEYLSEAQFQREATIMAHAAAEEVKRLRKLFGSVEAAAMMLVAEENGRPDRGKGSWTAYHAGMAAGLSGKAGEAADLFRSVIDDQVRSAAGQMERLLSNPALFRQEVRRLIGGHRQALGFPAV